MHREAQLVYATRGTMQVTTPKGRWLVPPDRAVWVPPRLEHAIDVLADIDMRTLYFDLAWLGREERSESLDSEFVVRVSRLLHETILALFAGRNDPDRTALLVRRDAGARGRDLGADTVAAVRVGDPVELQELVPARASPPRSRRLSMEGNVSVKQLASDLGYASVPAFSHAFRQVTGKTPTEFLAAK